MHVAPAAAVVLPGGLRSSRPVAPAHLASWLHQPPKSGTCDVRYREHKNPSANAVAALYDTGHAQLQVVMRTGGDVYALMYICVDVYICVERPQHQTLYICLNIWHACNSRHFAGDAQQP
jgi:hypothetical protein